MAILRVVVEPEATTKLATMILGAKKNIFLAGLLTKIPDSCTSSLAVLLKLATLLSITYWNGGTTLPLSNNTLLNVSNSKSIMVLKVVEFAHSF